MKETGMERAHQAARMSFAGQADAPSPADGWWNNGGDATPLDVRWRGPFEGYR